MNTLKIVQQVITRVFIKTYLRLYDCDVGSEYNKIMFVVKIVIKHSRKRVHVTVFNYRCEIACQIFFPPSIHAFAVCRPVLDGTRFENVFSNSRIDKTMMKVPRGLYLTLCFCS